MIELAQLSYFMGFTDMADLVSKQLFEEEAEKLQDPESYHPSVKRLADLMAKGIWQKADLQQIKEKYDQEVLNSPDSDDKDEANSQNGCTDAEEQVEAGSSSIPVEPTEASHA